MVELDNIIKVTEVCMSMVVINIYQMYQSIQMYAYYLI